MSESKIKDLERRITALENWRETTMSIAYCLGVISFILIIAIICMFIVR